MSPVEVVCLVALVLAWLPVMSRGEWVWAAVWAVFALCIVVAAFFFGDKEER